MPTPPSCPQIAAWTAPPRDAGMLFAGILSRRTTRLVLSSWCGDHKPDRSHYPRDVEDHLTTPKPHPNPGRDSQLKSGHRNIRPKVWISQDHSPSKSGLRKVRLDATAATAPTPQDHHYYRAITATTTASSLSRPLEDCEGCPALAGVRNLGRDAPSAGCSDLHRNFGVRSSRAASSGLQRAEPGPSSGGVPASPFVGPNSRRLRSAWHVVAIMRRRRRVHGWRLKLRVRRLPKRRAEGRQPDRH